MWVMLVICWSLLAGGGTVGQPGTRVAIGQSSHGLDQIHSQEAGDRGRHQSPHQPPPQPPQQPPHHGCEMCSYSNVFTKEFKLSREKSRDKMENTITSRTSEMSTDTPTISEHQNLVVPGTSQLDTRVRDKRTTRACPPGCSSCSAVNGCVTCERRYFMFLYRRRMRQTGMCATSCPPGYYGVRYRQYSKCNKCQITHCETCFSRHYCTRCFKPHIAHRGGCVQSCPPGSALDKLGEACLDSVDCQVGTWSPWSTCRSRGRVCARRGVKTRTRPVVQTPSPGGVVCQELQERRRCKIGCKEGCRHRKRGKRKRKRLRNRKRKKHRRRGRGKKRKTLKRRCRSVTRQRCRRIKRCQ